MSSIPIRRLLMFVLTVELAACGGGGGGSSSATASDLYVSAAGSDGNPGTEAQPLKTISKASEKAEPGTTVHVAAGDYPGGFETTASGAADAPIRYVSDMKWGARIVPPAGSNDNTAWDNRGANVIIDGFDIDGSAPGNGTRWLIGIFTAGANTTIQNNHVHHIAQLPSDCAQVGGAGIQFSSFYGGNNFKVLNNVVHHVADMGCVFIHPIYANGYGEIKNNLIYDSGGTSIHWWHDTRNLVIANNTVFGNRSGPGGGGNEFYFETTPADNVHVVNNIVFDNLFGIWESGALGSNITYQNNLVFGNVYFDWDLHGHVQTGTISGDPQFVNYIKGGGGDYHLRSTSPAVDKGEARYAPSTDMDGVLRPQGLAADIGAFEVPAAEEN